RFTAARLAARGVFVAAAGLHAAALLAAAARLIHLGRSALLAAVLAHAGAAAGAAGLLGRDRSGQCQRRGGGEGKCKRSHLFLRTIYALPLGKLIRAVAHGCVGGRLFSFDEHAFIFVNAAKRRSSSCEYVWLSVQRSRTKA